MDRKAIIDMTEPELDARYREVIQQQGQDAGMTLIEISRRSTLKVRDAAVEVRDASLLIYEASLEIVRLSKKLEWLTRILIALTILLAIIGLPPAVDTLVHYLGHEKTAMVERPAAEKVVPTTISTKDARKSTTATATTVTTATTSAATATPKVAPRTATSAKKP